MTEETLKPGELVNAAAPCAPRAGWGEIAVQVHVL
jgi:hypothetical protein